LDLVKTSDFDYDLPAKYIAQTPLEPRDSSRLLILNRSTGAIHHDTFRNLTNYLSPSDLLVLNETRVIPARLYAHKVPSAGFVEVLLLRRIDLLTWETMVGGKGITLGKRLQVQDGPQAEIIEVLSGPRRLVRFEVPIEPLFNQAGHVPLPPYIHTPLNDPERYQTVYAQTMGSVAAPTAGLHFTTVLMDRLSLQGVKFARVTLHVGLDTFAPVTEENPTEHAIHTEWCQVSSETVQAVRQAKQAGGRIIAVGTTSVRTLESAARLSTPNEIITSFEGPTDLFILPGYHFRAIDAMITNFHLPRSTLLMLVSAFAGREQIFDAYEEAKRNQYRFYSFGDAMLIL
jgi:S-adenosylmethionine:tRNA ribosyltransferase-isomerase